MKRVKLSEVCVIKTGKTPSTKNSAYFDGKINWYTPGDIVNSKQLHKSTRTITELALEQNKAVKFEPGTLLMTCIGEIGRLGITQDICSSNQQITGLVPNKSLNVNYLFYTLIFNKSRLKDVANNAIVPILNNKQLSAFQIPLPDLATQKAIAAKLDKADEIRQLNKKLIEQYDALTQSLFLDMFGDPVKNEKGWEKIALEKITSKIGSGSTPRGGKESYKTEGISLIRSMNVYDNRFLYKDLAYIDDIQATKLSNVEVEKGDILFNITGASVCRCTIVPNNVLPARVNQHVSIIRIKQNLANNKFINYQLIFESTKRQLLKIGAGGGAVMEAITKEQLQKYQVINPPISLQNEFAERVKAIEAQKALAQQALQQSENLFNSLLQESFQ